jgi:hypothetical protein
VDAVVEARFETAYSVHYNPAYIFSVKPTYVRRQSRSLYQSAIFRCYNTILEESI